MIRMTINLLNIKPGTLILYKSHNIFKELLFSIFKKQTSYNKAELITEECMISQFIDSDDVLTVEPKRVYSKQEAKELKRIFEDETLDNTKLKDIIKAVNTIRPNTLPEDTKVKDLIDNPYYKKMNAEKNSTKIYY